MMNFSMQQDWWILASMLALAFGVGFWGGILQHSHGSAGDGGSLTAYARLIAKDNTLNTVQGTVAPTNVSPITLPAGSTSAASRFRILAIGWFDNTTGIVQPSPTVTVRIAGTGIITLPIVAGIPSSANSNAFCFEIECQRRQGGNSVFFLGRVIFDDPASLTLVPRIDGIRTSVFNVDPTIDRTIDVQITNGVVTAGYATNVQLVQVDLY